ncbi:alpha/beta hydrolase [Vibrio sinus]|uniref:alpha/beta hydrolase n=1 Tax=Vibrio sinus TaxID=2946865 RepID=UPI003D7C719D
MLSSPSKMSGMPKMYVMCLHQGWGNRWFDLNSLSRQLVAWSLKCRAFLTSRKTRVPIMALSLENDFISPYSDNQLVALFSHGGESKEKISSNKISQGYEQSLDLAIKWLKKSYLDDISSIYS